MNASQVTRPQAQAIRSKVEPMRDYRHRLRTRMAKRGFPPDDPLFQLVAEAQQAIGELFMDVAARGYGGPVEGMKPPPINPLDRRSSRKPSNER